MPGNHGEISVVEQNGCDNDSKKTRRRKRKKKKKDKDVKEVGSENGDQLVMPSTSKTRKQFIPKIRKKSKSPKRCSCTSSRKGGCFCVMRPHKTGESSSCSSSPPSDPNDESFTHEMLRVMLETNDFCSIESNPHR